jgi:hypothetical protein
MKMEQKYRSALSMRVALEERLNRMARDKGIDIMRLRRHVAFDRLLARLFSGHTENLIVKGGYALELWINNARTTKDIDISFNGDLGGIWKGEKTSDPCVAHIDDDGHPVLRRSLERGIGEIRNARNLQYRSGLSIYQYGIYRNT